MQEILIGRPSWKNISAPLLDSMFALRHEMFAERLQWQVQSQHGKEKDWFDRLEPTYIVARHPEDTRRATGSWRLLPTTGPYMLKDVFPELLHGQAAPSDPTIWEASRFAVARHEHGASERLIRNLGLKTERFGPALQIGDVRTVALRIPMDDAAELSLWGWLEADHAHEAA